MDNKVKLVPMVLLSLYSLKLVALGATYADGLAIAALCSLIAFSKKQDKEDAIDKLQAQINIQHEMIQAQSNLVKQQSDELSNLKTHVASAKLGAQFRSVNGVK